MLTESDLSAKHASILVATEAVADAELVGRLLHDEFANVHLSVKPEAAVEDFETHLPSVLVLAFDTLEAAQRYYLGLYRLSTVIHTVPHRTIVLCNSHDLWNVYELCCKEHFDDYVLFWPISHDAARIRMSVHQSLRLMRAQTRAGEAWLRAGPQQPAVAASAATTAPRPVPAAPRAAGAATSPAPSAPAGPRPDEPLPGAAHGSRPATPEQAPAAPAARDGRPVVLLVEDDEFQQKLLARLLAGVDIKLVTAGTGAEAKAQMWEHKPELVLMDVGLPDTTGVEATRWMKSIAQFAHVPIVMVTGHSERHIVVESLKAGAADFLVKPFDRNTLVEKLRLFLPAAAA